MPSNFTANYNLSQWERTDKVQMEDFNEDNAKIDGAIKAEADLRAAQVSALNTAVSKLGNCRIYRYDYVGNGKYGEKNPTIIHFPVRPVLLIIFGLSSYLFAVGSDDNAIYQGRWAEANNSMTNVVNIWKGKDANIWSGDEKRQMNEKNSPYRVIAFFAEDQK